LAFTCIYVVNFGFQRQLDLLIGIEGDGLMCYGGGKEGDELWRKVGG